MKCGGCVRAVERRLLEQQGVHQASVNLLTRTAWVGLEPASAPTALPALVESLAALGFQARPRGEGDAVEGHHRLRRERHWWEQWRQLVAALTLLLLSGLGHLAMVGGLPESLLRPEGPLAVLVRPGPMPWWPPSPCSGRAAASWCAASRRPGPACPAWTPWWASGDQCLRRQPGGLPPAGHGLALLLQRAGDAAGLRAPGPLPGGAGPPPHRPRPRGPRWPPARHGPAAAGGRSAPPGAGGRTAAR